MTCCQVMSASLKAESRCESVFCGTRDLSFPTSLIVFRPEFLISYYDTLVIRKVYLLFGKLFYDYFNWGNGKVPSSCSVEFKVVSIIANHFSVISKPN